MTHGFPTGSILSDRFYTILHYKNEACKRLHKQGKMTEEEAKHKVRIWRGFSSRYANALKDRYNLAKRSV